ncbi:MAG: DUF5069 domain-containing protein [Candidatus Latescibacteria bacterium]|jgi:gluconokinase|nr:DUF5069 domain-containing protein [Candidatus Latescibacterota bacterium]
MAYPRNPYDEEGGMNYFPRMLDKIRMNLKDELPEDYHGNLGSGFDGRCCDFLQVSYDDVVKQVEAGGSDADVLAWCFENGRNASENDILLFNSFMSKRGWRDESSEFIAEIKERASISDRNDIQTFYDLIQADEERM